MALAILTTSCTTEHTNASSSIAAPTAWIGRSGETALISDWWTVFEDPVLDRLVSDGLTRNLGVREAVERLREAQLLVAAQRGGDEPSVNLNAGEGKSRSISTATGQPFIAESHQTQFVASYEVDLWGRNGALERATSLDADASRETMAAVRLMVAAAIADAYFRLRALDSQVDLASRTLVSRRRSLDLTLEQRRHGYANALEAAQAQAELQATARSLSQFREQAELQERTLNLLLGEVPQPVPRGRAIADLRADEIPDAGLPSALLRRRPDIAVAETKVAASDARLDAARARLLPTINLSASLGSVESTALHGDPFSIWSVGASVLAPLFNGGSLRAQADASASRRDQALIAYQRTVLTAFNEVESQLASLAREGEQLEAAQIQRDALASALRYATRRHAEGYASYLDELLAERSLFAAEQSIVQLQADQLTTDVALYKALGGGWGKSVEKSEVVHQAHIE